MALVSCGKRRGPWRSGPGLSCFALAIGCALLLSRGPLEAREPMPIDLRFANADLEEVYHALRAHFASQAIGWHHPPISEAGNFITEIWCHPEVDADACESQSGEFADWHGARFFEISVLRYPPALDVFGLTAAASANPADTAWGTHAYLSLTDEGVTVDQFGLLFRHFDGSNRGNRRTANGHIEVGLADRVLSAGTSFGYRVAAKTFDFYPVSMSDRQGMVAELARYLRSAESLRQTYRERNISLRETVLTGIRAGAAYTQVETAPPQNGIPPQYREVPLTTAEQAQWREQATQDLAERITMIDANAEAIHGVLATLIPISALSSLLD